MAGRAVGFGTGDVALVADTAKVGLLLKAAANHSIEIAEFAVSFDGIDNTAKPILVEIVRCSTDGTMITLTPEYLDDMNDDTIQTAGYAPDSAEPTVADVLMTFRVHPQVGLIYQPPSDAPIRAKGGGRIGLRITAAGALSGARLSAKALE